MRRRLTDFFTGLALGVLIGWAANSLVALL